MRFRSTGWEQNLDDSPEKGVNGGVPGVLEFHGEGVPAGSNGGGVLDGVWESTARSRAWSSTSKDSCDHVER
jgi:hypothetical protein